jgi:hypothetical protein
MDTIRVALTGEKKISNFATLVAVEKLRYITFSPKRRSDHLIDRRAGHNLLKSRLKGSTCSVSVHI